MNFRMGAAFSGFASNSDEWGDGLNPFVMRNQGVKCQHARKYLVYGSPGSFNCRRTNSALRWDPDSVFQERCSQTVVKDVSKKSFNAVAQFTPRVQLP